jgi:hypothetical protein
MLQIQNFLRARVGVELVPDPDTQLFCNTCQTWKPDEQFHRHRGHKARRHRAFACKPCSTAKRADYRERNREKEREREQRYWREVRKHRRARRLDSQKDVV